MARLHTGTCGYKTNGDYEISGFAHAQSMTTCVGILYHLHQRRWKKYNLQGAIFRVLEPSALAEIGNDEARTDR